MKRRGGRRTPWLPRFFAGLSVAAAALCTGESWSRAHPAPSVADVPAAQSGAATVLHGNPWLLWELIPGDHLERGGHVHVNAAGFRDRDDRGLKSRPRALALGDSSVYGFGVDDDEVFTARLEAEVPADFVNGAVPGYSTFQALNTLRGRGLALDPDLLLVGTLWSDNNFDNFVDRDLLASYAGWEETPTGRLRAALGRSALFRRLDWALRVEPGSAGARTVGWQVGGSEARSGKRRVSIGDYVDNLATFCSIAARRGAGVVFIELANREDLHPVTADPAWRPYREAMATVAGACHAPLVSVPAAFVASGQSADALFLDEMYPTAAGHAVLADAVAAALRTARWPETPLVAVDPGRVTPPTDPFEGHGAAAEAEGLRPGNLVLDLSLRSGSAVIIAARDAAGPPEMLPLAVAEVSSADAADGAARVSLQLSRVPERVVLSATYDAAGDGPSPEDVRVVSAPLPVAGAVLGLDLR